MPRRPKQPDPTSAEIEIAFARNVAWLLKFGPILPRHLLLIGWYVNGLPVLQMIAELQRWAPLLDQLPTGDFRITPAAEAKVAALLGMSHGMLHGVSGSETKSPEIRGSVSQSYATCEAAIL